MTAQSASTPTLDAQSRTLTGRKVRSLRNEGKIPAVMYGHNKESLSLTLDQRTFEKLYHQSGSTTLISLSVDGKTPVKVLIHDVQVNALRHNITHADLYQVNLKEKLTTEIPVNFVGVADAVDILGGIFLTVRSVVEIECLPEDLVQELDADISLLKTFDDSLTVANLVVPKGIVILTDPEQVIASVTEPISEEELAALDEVPEATVQTEFATEDGTVKPEGETEETKN
jgi:large subunit ribosomal protein L25